MGCYRISGVRVCLPFKSPGCARSPGLPRVRGHPFRVGRPASLVYMTSRRDICAGP